MMSFMKTGQQTHDAMKQEKAKQEAFKEMNKGIQRFWMPENSTRRITFLDGVVKDSLLDVSSWNEHQIKIGKSWRNWFNCTEQGLTTDEECPLCAQEGGYSTLVTFLTIIDHNQYMDKKGGHHQHVRRLFACKSATFQRLQVKALKYGGLAGLTFDVSRFGDKSSAVGDDFEFVCGNSMADMLTKYALKQEGEDSDEKVCRAFDYNKTLMYLNAEKLRQVVPGLTPPGAPPAFTGNVAENHKAQQATPAAQTEAQTEAQPAATQPAPSNFGQETVQQNAQNPLVDNIGPAATDIIPQGDGSPTAPAAPVVDPSAFANSL